MKRLLEQCSIVFLVSLLFSCSGKQGLIPSEIIVGKWEMVNLHELNTRHKIHYEEVIGSTTEPFDPITRLSVTYNDDGTGYSEVEHEYQPKYQRSFTYQFISQDVYESVNENSGDVYESRVLAVDKSRFTIILIRAYEKGIEEQSFADLDKPMPQTFVRTSK